MTILSIGKSTYDITIPVDSYPTENSKMIVTEKLEGSGGSAANISYLLGKWNEEAYFAGTVGYDDFGSSIKKELESVDWLPADKELLPKIREKWEQGVLYFNDERK